MWRIKAALRRISSTTSCTTTSKRSSSSSSSNAITTPLPPSAATLVLKTPELLELILSHLPTSSLLSLQSVCRHWALIIRSSTLLSRRLYLEPAFSEPWLYPTDNPFLKLRFPKMTTYLLTGNPKWRPKFVEALGSEDLDRLGAEFFECETASWRGMLLTQPPIKEVVVYAGHEDGGDEDEEKGPRTVEDLTNSQVVLKSATGVTMGMIWEASRVAKRRSVEIRGKRVRRNDSGYASIGSAETEVEEGVAVDIIEVDED